MSSPQTQPAQESNEDDGKKPDLGSQQRQSFDSEDSTGRKKTGLRLTHSFEPALQIAELTFVLDQKTFRLFPAKIPNARRLRQSEAESGPLKQGQGGACGIGRGAR